MRETLGRQLYPLGITLDRWSVAVDAHGSVYLQGDWLVLLGLTFVEGLSCLLNRESAFKGLDLNEDDLTWGPDEQVITWPALPPGSPHLA